ncbi:MAG: hypothetical protein ACKOCN_04865 [Planctomycetaceae bacterium]
MSPRAVGAAIAAGCITATDGVPRPAAVTAATCTAVVAGEVRPTSVYVVDGPPVSADCQEPPPLVDHRTT